MSYFEPEVEPTDTRLYDLYVNWCTNNHVKPTISDYMVWLDDRYDYEPKDMPPVEMFNIPDEVYIESIIDEGERLKANI